MWRRRCSPFSRGARRSGRRSRLGDDGVALSRCCGFMAPVVGALALPAIAAAYVAFTFDSALQYWRGRGGYWKGGSRRRCGSRARMTTVREALPARAPRREFSRRLMADREERRGPILAFYRFVAPPTMSPIIRRCRRTKLNLLDDIDEPHRRGPPDPQAEPLRRRSPNPLAPEHAWTFSRPFAWTHEEPLRELVGADGLLRAVGGAGRALRARRARRDPESWPISDALCSALQVINHLQDCGQDYRDLDRVYVPSEPERRGDRVRGAGRAKRLARPARRDRRACAAHGGVAGQGAAPHARSAPCFGHRRHPSAGAKPERAALHSRSAFAARSPRAS